ncbi:hypothetical protein MKZ38_009773 [Zalerion maritima]|uniref:Uncharacterized protein n=1 Tax=Zalerion maritima TaxID=339359 RepID=A0AAD5RYK7_9PEZI|nr:hypothetical protein MKZ38_009773 [Zalerion maritima]
MNPQTNAVCSSRNLNFSTTSSTPTLNTSTLSSHGHQGNQAGCLHSELVDFDEGWREVKPRGKRRQPEQLQTQNLPGRQSVDSQAAQSLPLHSTTSSSSSSFHPRHNLANLTTKSPSIITNTNPSIHFHHSLRFSETPSTTSNNNNTVTSRPQEPSSHDRYLVLTSRNLTQDTIPSTHDQHSLLNDDNMAPRDSRRGGGQNRNKRDADLTCLLNEDEKAELLKLVRSIIGRMHHRIARVFNSVPEIDPTPTHFHSHGHECFWQLVSLAHILPAADRNKENEPDVLPSDTTLHNAHTAPEVKAEQALHREEAEALTPGRLGELKKEVVVYFRKWNSNVTKRFTDITASKNGITNPKIVPMSSVASVRARAAEAAGFLSPSGDYDRSVMKNFPPINTTLVSLPEEKRALILHSMFLLVLSLDQYTSYTRVFLLYLTASLNLPLGVLVAEEMRIARGLSDNVPDYTPDELAQKRSEEAKNGAARRTRFGANAIKDVAHALAAPLIAAGLGSVLGIGIGHQAAATLLGTLSNSQISACNLFGLIGARPGAKSIACCAKDLQDFALVSLHSDNKDDYRDGRAVQPEDRRMRLVFCLDGWLDPEVEPDSTWDCIGSRAESFVMKWELETLTKLGGALQTIVRSVSWIKAKEEIVEKTCMSDPAWDSDSSNQTNSTDTNINIFEVAKVLKESSWPRDLMKISKVVDNPWSIGMVRADKAGAALADIIINRGHGERPVSLIGYSLGARAIYTCLMILAERRVFGMVESVVMIGTPAPADSRVWCALRTIVAGRLVNVFSKNDYMLGFLYRTSSTQFGIAGLEEIRGANGVENLDVSHMVRGHLRYQNLVSIILRMLDWEDLNLRKVSEDVCAVAVCDEKHTDTLITEFNTKHSIPTKIKAVEETKPDFAFVPKLPKLLKSGKPDNAKKPTTQSTPEWKLYPKSLVREDRLFIARSLSGLVRATEDRIFLEDKANICHAPQIRVKDCLNLEHLHRMCHETLFKIHLAALDKTHQEAEVPGKMEQGLRLPMATFPGADSNNDLTKEFLPNPRTTRAKDDRDNPVEGISLHPQM